MCFRLPVQAPSVRSGITDFIRSNKDVQSYDRVFDNKRKRDEMGFNAGGQTDDDNVFYCMYYM